MQMSKKSNHTGVVGIDLAYQNKTPKGMNIYTYNYLICKISKFEQVKKTKLSQKIRCGPDNRYVFISECED